MSLTLHGRALLPPARRLAALAVRGTFTVASVVAVTLSLTLGAGPVRAEESLDARWDSLRGEAATNLHGVAKAYASAQLYRTRADLLDMVLVLDPEDTKARKLLKYRKGPDGWIRSSRWKQPRNLRPPRADLIAKRDAWSRWFGDEAAELAREAFGRKRFALHRKILALVLPMAPDHTMLRTVNGEVRMPQGHGLDWVLKETWSALQRRPALHDIATRAVESHPMPRVGTQSADEPLDAVESASVLQGPHVRVLGSVPEAELTAHFARLEAAWPVFETAFGLEAPSWTSDMAHAEGLTACVFASLETGNAFWAALPDMTADRIEFGSRLAALVVPGRTAILVKSDESGIRLEAGVRLVLDSICITRLGITSEHAWISEGLNSYLQWPVTRTRLVGTVNEYAGRYAPEVEGPATPLPTSLPVDDWLAAGRVLLGGPDKPDFHEMVAKPLNKLTAGELLYGYCLAAYLLEGRPDVHVAFLQDLGSRRSVEVEAPLAEHLGLDAAGLEARVLRWLLETTSLSRAE